MLLNNKKSIMPINFLSEVDELKRFIGLVNFNYLQTKKIEIYFHPKFTNQEKEIFINFYKVVVEVFNSLGEKVGYRDKCFKVDNNNLFIDGEYILDDITAREFYDLFTKEFWLKI